MIFCRAILGCKRLDQQRSERMNGRRQMTGMAMVLLDIKKK
jgi:hypothetical protein